MAREFIRSRDKLRVNVRHRLDGMSIASRYGWSLDRQCNWIFRILPLASSLNLLEDILGPSPSLLADTHNVSPAARIDTWSISDLSADFQ